MKASNRPMVKMLHADGFFPSGDVERCVAAVRDIRALPKLEGTVHVNMALVVKFIRNYFFNPVSYPDIARQNKARDDEFLFQQGPARGGDLPHKGVPALVDGWEVPVHQV